MRIDVSVVVTFYNMENFVHETIYSIISDESNIQLILIDDCSTDSTREKINEFVKNHKKINIDYVIHFNDVNSGVSVSRNTGIELAKGTYLTFLDGDDLLFKNSISKRLERLKSSGASLIYGNYIRIDQSSKILSGPVYIKKNGKYKDLLKTNFIAIGSGMIRLDDLREIRFKKVKSEDYLFWLEYTKTNKKIVYLDDSVMKYRIIKNSRSKNKSIKKFLVIIDIYLVYRNLNYPRYISMYYSIIYLINRLFVKGLLTRIKNLGGMR